MLLFPCTYDHRILYSVHLYECTYRIYIYIVKIWLFFLSLSLSLYIYTYIYECTLDKYSYVHTYIHLLIYRSRECTSMIKRARSIARARYISSFVTLANSAYFFQVLNIALKPRSDSLIFFVGLRVHVATKLAWVRSKIS